MKHIMTILFIFFGLSSAMNAQQLVYKFINPSFGGFYYNAQWLMASAQAQNEHTETYKSTTSTKTSALQDFKESFNRQVLSQLTRKFYENAFGETGLKEGHYEMGDYIIDIANGTDGMTVTISDPKSGDNTQIIIPYF